MRTRNESNTKLQKPCFSLALDIQVLSSDDVPGSQESEAFHSFQQTRKPNILLPIMYFLTVGDEHVHALQSRHLIFVFLSQRLDSLTLSTFVKLHFSNLFWERYSWQLQLSLAVLFSLRLRGGIVENTFPFFPFELSTPREFFPGERVCDAQAGCMRQPG